MYTLHQPGAKVKGDAPPTPGSLGAAASPLTSAPGAFLCFPGWLDGHLQQHVRFGPTPNAQQGGHADVAHRGIHECLILYIYIYTYIYI